jgi:hypothetical protein
LVDETGCPTGEPSPAQGFGGFDVAAREGGDRDPHRGRSVHGPAYNERREAVEQQIRRSWIGRRRRGKRGVGHLGRRRRLPIVR